MKITISHASQFRDEFRQAGREDQFSYEALNMLYEYFEDIDPDLELDVVAICCEYCEQSWQDIASDYDVNVDGLEDDEAKQHVMNYLCDNTCVIGETSNGFVHQVF